MNFRNPRFLPTWPRVNAVAFLPSGLGFDSVGPCFFFSMLAIEKKKLVKIKCWTSIMLKVLSA